MTCRVSKQNSDTDRLCTVCSETQHTVPFSESPSLCEKGNGQEAMEAEVRTLVSKGHRLGGNQGQPGASNVFPPTQAGGAPARPSEAVNQFSLPPFPPISSLGKMLTPHRQLLASFPKT